MTNSDVSSAEKKEWFIHVIHFREDQGDSSKNPDPPKNPDASDPSDEDPWLITIDHCHHKDDKLSEWEKQHGKPGSPGQGYDSIAEVVAKLGDIMQRHDGVRKFWPWRYVHKLRSDGTIIINTVFSMSTSYDHCPSDAAANPVYPGYPWNDPRIPNVVAAMMANDPSHPCPPCLK